MKRIHSLMIALGLLVLLPAAAQAFFQCDYQYKAQGQSVKAIIQIEEMNGHKALVFRDAKSSAGSTQGMIYALGVVGVKKTALGRIVRSEVEVEGAKITVDVILPEVLPGPGRLVWGNQGSESLKQCRPMPVRLR